MAVNVPTTWINSGMSEFDSRLFAAINDMLLEPPRVSWRVFYL